MSQRTSLPKMCTKPKGPVIIYDPGGGRRENGGKPKKIATPISVWTNFTLPHFCKAGKITTPHFVIRHLNAIFKQYVVCNVVHYVHTCALNAGTLQYNTNIKATSIKNGGKLCNCKSCTKLAKTKLHLSGSL